MMPDADTIGSAPAALLGLPRAFSGRAEVPTADLVQALTAAGEDGLRFDRSILRPCSFARNELPGLSRVGLNLGVDGLAHGALCKLQLVALLQVQPGLRSGVECECVADRPGRRGAAPDGWMGARAESRACPPRPTPAAWRRMVKEFVLTEPLPA